MKKYLFLVFVFVMMLSGYNSTFDIADKAFVYENGGFSGIENDNFTILIHKDGTFSYTEGIASSHYANRDKCNWSLENGILTLTEKVFKSDDLVNRFKVEKNSLVFLSEGSTGFIYTTLSDQDEFYLYKNKTADKILGKTFIREKGGYFGTHDEFFIKINKDGTVDYSEGGGFSYLPHGHWSLDENILTITEKHDDNEYSINHFILDNDTLIFKEENSDNFNRLKISDGDKFWLKK